jgi:hypothetical protein
VVALGLLLVLVGFVLIMPSGALPGAASARNVRLGTRLFTTRGPDGLPSRRYRVVQVLMGLVVMAAGVIIIAVSG